MMLPPPMPWIARKTISSFIDWLTPARTDPSRKTTIPPRKNILRPYRSDSRPTMGTAVVEATRYAVVTR